MRNTTLPITQMAYFLREPPSSHLNQIHLPYQIWKYRMSQMTPIWIIPLPSRVVEGRANRTSPIPRETPNFEVSENLNLPFPEPP